MIILIVLEITFWFIFWTNIRLLQKKKYKYTIRKLKWFIIWRNSHSTQNYHTIYSFNNTFQIIFPKSKTKSIHPTEFAQSPFNHPTSFASDNAEERIVRSFLKRDPVSIFPRTTDDESTVSPLLTIENVVFSFRNPLANVWEAGTSAQTWMTSLISCCWRLFRAIPHQYWLIQFVLWFSFGFEPRVWGSGWSLSVRSCFNIDRCNRMWLRLKRKIVRKFTRGVLNDNMFRHF